MEDLTGRRLGPYQITSTLGAGGMATVYKAHQPAMDRHVALKILPRHFASDPLFVARFQQEARIIAQLQHPHILPVAMAAVAKANPHQKFLMLDFDYDPPIDNVLAYTYATDQGAFLAGYVAAAVSKTGKVGTFGGFQFPTVEAYMDGFALGVNHYNQRNGTNLRVLGWDVARRIGYFTNEFALPVAGARMANRLLAEGADMIFPVAGLAGVGAADSALAHGRAYVIGVDTDWAESYPERASIILTSVEKRYHLSAISAIRALAEGKYVGGTHVGTIANGEIGLAPFHRLSSLVSEQIRNDLGQIKTDIMIGKIKTKPGA